MVNMMMKLPSYVHHHHHHHHHQAFSSRRRSQFYAAILYLIIILIAGLVNLSSPAEGVRPAQTMMMMMNSSDSPSMRETVRDGVPSMCQAVHDGKVMANDIGSPLAFAKRNVELAASELAALRSSSPITFGFWLSAYFSTGYDRLYRATLPNSFDSWPLLPTPRPLTLPYLYIRGFPGATKFVDDHPYVVMKRTWDECSVDFDRVHSLLRGVLGKLEDDDIAEEDRVEIIESLRRTGDLVFGCDAKLWAEGTESVASFIAKHSHMKNYMFYSSFAGCLLLNLQAS